MEDRDKFQEDKDWHTGEYFLEREMGSIFWEWPEGSRCLFWRCIRGFRKSNRDGQKQWQVGLWPRFQKSQKSARDTEVGKKDQNKLAKVLRKGYFRAGDVRSLTQYFYVPNLEYIRIVYNGKMSGLNGAIWNPNFALPMVASTLR